MQEKAKTKAHDISWAYRLSQRLHLLKRAEIELTATPEQCLQHLEKIYARDVYQLLEADIINNYNVHDVIIRSYSTLGKRSRGNEDAFVLCRLEGKGDKTIVSLEVSLGKASFDFFRSGFIGLPVLLVGLGICSVLTFNYPGGLVNILLILPMLIPLFLLILLVKILTDNFQQRDKLLTHIVDYMFRIEEKGRIASLQQAELKATHQSTHLAAGSESHADRDQAG